MGYSSLLAERVRNVLANQPTLQEMPKMGGLSFMLRNKVCVRIEADELVCRIGNDFYDACLALPGTREWIYKGKPMRGWIYVGPAGTESDAQLAEWIDKAIKFNKTLK